MAELYSGQKRKFEFSKFFGRLAGNNPADEYLKEMDNLIKDIESEKNLAKQSDLVQEVIRIGQHALNNEKIRMQIIKRYTQIRKYLNEQEQHKLFIDTIIL